MTEATAPDASRSGAYLQETVLSSSRAVRIRLSNGAGARPARTARKAASCRPRIGSATRNSVIFLPAASAAAQPVASSHCRLNSRTSPSMPSWRTSAPEASRIRVEKSRSLRRSFMIRTRPLTSRRIIMPSGPLRCGTKVSFRFSREIQVIAISPENVAPSRRRIVASHGPCMPSGPGPRSARRKPGGASPSTRIDPGSMSKSSSGYG